MFNEEQNSTVLSLNEIRSIKESAHSFWEITKNYKPFKDYIKKAFNDYKGSDDLTLDTFTRLFSLTLDPGLKRDIIEGEKKQAGIPFLNRQGFAYFLKEAIGLSAPDNKEGDFFLANSNFVIYRFDLAGIGQLEEKEGDKIINEAGRILNNLHDKLDLPEGFKLYVGRYGGDEFVVSLVGSSEISDDVFRDKTKKLEDELRKKFKKQEECQEGDVAIKDGWIDEIILPSDEIEKKIFLSYLNRGIILSQEELQREKNHFLKEDGGKVDEEKLKQLIDDSIATNIYGEDRSLNLMDKISYYQQFHSELYFPIRLALKLDELTIEQLKQNPESEAFHANSVIKFIENFLVDPLLNKIVISRFDLAEHIKRGEFSQLFAFEVKLKEVNDYFSLAYGDRLIKQLWEKIKIAVGEKNLEYFSIGRAGATIFLGLKKGAEISQDKLREIIDKFKEIKSIKMPEKNIDNFIGFYQNDEIDSDKPDEEIRKMFTGVNNSWLDQVFNYINENFESFKAKINVFLSNTNDFKIEDTIDFLIVYFFGKRKEIRIRNVINYLSKKGEEFKTLTEFFFKI